MKTQPSKPHSQKTKQWRNYIKAVILINESLKLVYKWLLEMIKWYTKMTEWINKYKRRVKQLVGLEAQGVWGSSAPSGHQSAVPVTFPSHFSLCFRKHSSFLSSVFVSFLYRSLTEQFGQSRSQQFNQSRQGDSQTDFTFHIYWHNIFHNTYGVKAASQKEFVFNVTVMKPEVPVNQLMS